MTKLAFKKIIFLPALVILGNFISTGNARGDSGAGTENCDNICQQVWQTCDYFKDPVGCDLLKKSAEEAGCPCGASGSKDPGTGSGTSSNQDAPVTRQTPFLISYEDFQQKVMCYCRDHDVTCSDDCQWAYKDSFNAKCHLGQPEDTIYLEADPQYESCSFYHNQCEDITEELFDERIRPLIAQKKCTYLGGKQWTCPPNTKDDYNLKLSQLSIWGGFPEYQINTQGSCRRPMEEANASQYDVKKTCGIDTAGICQAQKNGGFRLPTFRLPYNQGIQFPSGVKLPGQ